MSRDRILSLTIRDFAIISALDIEFSTGLTVLSGETGAGKSILFDALGLLLGDRAESGTIRAERPRAELSAHFQLAVGSPAQRWLDEHDLLDPDAPSELLLRRKIQAEGQSKAFINGQPAPLRQLKDLAACLIDIHGQHAHQSLLRGAEQRRILDGYGQLQDATSVVASHYRALRQAQRRLSELEAPGTESADRLALMRYQLEELDGLSPSDDELCQLKDDFRRLSQVDELRGAGATAFQMLYAGEPSAYDLLAQGQAQLEQAAAMDASFGEARTACEQAQIALKEAALMAESAVEALESDPEQLAEISARLARYEDLARKHRVKPEELAEHWAQLQRQCETLANSSEERERLQLEITQLTEAYQGASQELSRLRSEAAGALGAAVSEALKPLGLPHAQCEIAVTHLAENAPTAYGQDQIEFRVSMNPGQPAAPLSKVASGGELARASLAFQVICHAQSQVPILLFDEVDVGIGGAVAEVVGQHMHALAEDCQIFCVTHQAQVAAQADNHLAVHKTVADGQTFTRIEALDESHRVEEIARMIGGVTITEQTREHARDMRQRARAA